MNKRQRRTDGEWQQLIEQQQRSGLSASVFCQQHGLSSKTFYKRRRAQAGATTATDARFIKIQPSSTPVAATATTAVLHYHGSQLHLPAGVDARWLAQLMQALS